MVTILCTLLALFRFRAIGHATTGASAGLNNVTGECPFRQEINVFAGSNAAWDLYILSLRQLRQTNQSDYPFILQITSNSPRLTGPLCHNSGSRANAIDVP